MRTNINIDLNPAKEGKWYAKELITKGGDTTVTFFQRDGKQTLLQKFKDFRDGVRSGTELASKYCKELGLPEDTFSNPKIKHTKNSNSNQQLNQLFGTTKRMLDENIHFDKSDLLVSHFDSEKDIQVELDFIAGNLLCEKNMKLKVGAQVMCIINIKSEAGDVLICNGSQGIITEFCAVTGCPRVKYNNGIDIDAFTAVKISKSGVL